MAFTADKFSAVRKVEVNSAVQPNIFARLILSEISKWETLAIYAMVAQE